MCNETSGKKLKFQKNMKCHSSFDCYFRLVMDVVMSIPKNTLPDVALPRN